MTIIQSTLLKQFPQLVHGFSVADHGLPGSGNMSLSTGQRDQVLENRRRFCEQLGLRFESLVMADQVHSDLILRVTRADGGKGAKSLFSPLGRADALCTNEPDLPLAVLVADCAAVFLHDALQQAIGLAHCGWRGAAAGIVPKLVSRMREEFATEVGNLFAWVSPCIGRDNFQVGSEVLEIFRQQQPEITRQEGWFHASSCTPDRVTLDLRTIVLRQLLVAGIPASQIEISGECTYQSPRLFSYRRTGPGSGHMMGLLAMRPG